ncbi:MAG: plastocyanin/azurin family copper-binding protein [Nitrososphaerales archaeon]
MRLGKKVVLIFASLLLIPLVLSNASADTANVSIVVGAALTTNAKFYDPHIVKVKIGTTVVWTNYDTAAHTVTSGAPTSEDSGQLFDSGLFGPNRTFSHKFDNEGTFDYYCVVHPWMTGKVIVSSEAGNFGILKNTEGGRFSVELVVSPPIIEAGKSAKFVLSFFNPTTQLTERNIVYDFAVTKDGQKLVDKKQVQALSGVVVEEVSFESDQSGTFMVSVENVHYATEPPDPTNDDVSFSVDVVGVPERRGEAMPPMTQRTDAGRFDVQVIFSPTVIEPNKPQNFAISFFDSRTGAVARNIFYDFAIIKDGKDLVIRKGQNAPTGTSVESFTFKEDQTGSVTVKVANARLFGEPAVSADAAEFSVTVVPEFPLGIMLVATAAIAAIVLVGRFKKLPHF